MEKENDEDEYEQEGQETLKFQTVTTRLSFTVSDCLDFLFVSREMFCPTKRSRSEIKRSAMDFLFRLTDVLLNEWTNNDPVLKD